MKILRVLAYINFLSFLFLICSTDFTSVKYVLVLMLNIAYIIFYGILHDLYYFGGRK